MTDASGSENPATPPSTDPSRTVSETARGVGSSGPLNSSGRMFFAAAALAVIGVVAVSFLVTSGSRSDTEQEEPETELRLGSARGYTDQRLRDEEPAETPVVEVQAEPELTSVERTRERVVVESPSQEELMLDDSREALIVAFRGAAPRTPASPGVPATGTGLAGAPVAGDSGPLASILRPTRLEGTSAGLIGDRNMTISAGTNIPCILETAIDSTLSGMVSCRVPHDIVSSSQRVTLLDRGTRILGEYVGDVEVGRARLFILWTRAETPEGVVIALDSPAADPLGRSGVDGVVDSQFWTRFGGALLLSVVDDSLAILADRSGSEFTDSSSVSAAESAVATALSSTINVPVILRKNPGERVSVFVARDLSFSDVYGLAPR